MNTDEISTNLAQVAYSLANASHSGNKQHTSAIIDMQIQESLDFHEATALKTFLLEEHSLDKLLSNADNPPIENDWWII